MKNSEKRKIEIEESRSSGTVSNTKATIASSPSTLHGFLTMASSSDLKNGFSSFVVMQVDPTLLMMKWIYFLRFVAMNKGFLLSSGLVNEITHVGQRFVGVA
ncbi:unnamed protein product [Camellia sinensis]